ncbi:MAG: hypothetical protein LBN43_01095 [Oscillospiraceae bacterium]|nr:hypothetical protein [Oscillospiraceae bacterium]
MKTKTPIRLSIGSVSIMMLFAVICLILLAALSLVASNSQLNLANRTAEHVTNYYAADFTASEIYESIKSGAKPLSHPEIKVEIFDAYSENGAWLEEYYYSVPIDENRELSVILTVSGQDVEISEWKIVSVGDWMPDDGLLLFDVEDNPF